MDTMTFPLEPLPIQAELMVDGAWVDITADVYARDPITITRGRSAEAAEVDPGTCTLTLNNRGGKYTVKHPLSPYHGKIGRNTPIRISVHTGSAYLVTAAGGEGRATTPDSPALDITGDIDVRADLTTATWRGAFVNGYYELLGKYDLSTNQRSWRLIVSNSGIPEFGWSPDGAALLTASGGVPLPFDVGQRGAVRATMDVDNGLGGYTVTWYTAPTLAGPWTRLSQLVTTNGTTSIASTSAAMAVGNIPVLFFGTIAARWHGVEVRDGIDGPAVATPDFSSQTPGTGNFTDAAGRVWTVTDGAEITNRRIRFVGEVPSWPRMRDTSGQDRYVQIQAAGILRRLSQGQAPLQSTLRRRIPTEPTLLAYWPMEDGAESAQASSPIAGVAPLRTTGFDFASADTLAGSGAMPTLDSNGGKALATMSGTVPAPPAGAAASWKVEFIYRLDKPDTTVWTVMRVLSSTGTARDWFFQMSSTIGRVLAHDADGNEVLRRDTDLTTFAPFGDWYRVQIKVEQSGTNISWTVLWIHIDGNSGQISGTFPGTVGRVTAVAAPADGYASALDGMALGHISVMTNTGSTVYNEADHGFTAETTAARLTRLAQEENLPITVLPGVDDPSTALGPQTPETALALVQEAADADQGVLYEDRNTVGLLYRSRATLYNQTPTTVAYEDLAPGLATPDDDQLVQNDITISRPGGSSGRVTSQEGALSVLAPPAGVGPYPTSATLNLAADSQTQQAAGWRVHLGTVDEPRYPTVPVNLARTPELIEQITSLDTGSRLRIDDLPADFPPGPIDALVQGYTEQLSQYQWDWTGNCTPASPYTVAVLQDGDAVPRADTGGSELAAAVDADATTLAVTTTGIWRWITSDDFADDFPFDVQVGGEVVTVTAVAAGAPSQLFTVTRGVNGIRKPHPAGEDVRLASPSYVAL
ncbi:hypothetical protein [Streptomyces tremellae]|uniref:Minor tail protein n=1 Tax=Streptomyces tremellae TaxID=1124239 RepID=A0ABP7EK64_9ACTN